MNHGVVLTCIPFHCIIMVFITCPKYFEYAPMCFNICVFSVLCVRSLYSEDHILRSCILLGRIVYTFREHLKCSKKIFLLSDFLSLRGG